MKITKRLLAVSIALPLMSAPALAEPATQPAAAAVEEAKLPSVQEVIDRYIEATGGKDAYASIRSRRLEGTMSLPMQGMRGTTVALVDENGGRVNQAIEGVMEVSRGVSGDVAWELNSVQGPRLLSDAEATETKRLMRIDADTSLSTYKSSKVTGVEQVDGQDAYVMELVDANDAPERRWYAVESGLLLKTQKRIKEQGMEIDVVTRFSEYQKADPIVMPMLAVTEFGMLKMELRTTKVEHNVDLPADALAVPAEIKQLLERQAPTTKPAN